MPIPFSRSTRALYATSFRPSLTWLGIILGLVVIWLAWFFGAGVSLYEHARTVSIRADGLALVDVTEEAGARIKMGQTAQVYVRQAGGEETAVPAVVMNFAPRPDGAGVRVELYALGDTFAENPLQDGQQGRVSIEVEQVSPATLALRSAGQYWQSDASAAQSVEPVDLNRSNPLQ